MQLKSERDRLVEMLHYAEREAAVWKQLAERRRTEIAELTLRLKGASHGK